MWYLLYIHSHFRICTARMRSYATKIFVAKSWICCCEYSIWYDGGSAAGPWQYIVLSHATRQRLKSNLIRIKNSTKGKHTLILRWSTVTYSTHTVNLAPAQSHIWHMLCKICFTIILCWLEAYLAHHVSKNGEAYLTHVKQNMLHMWLIALPLRQHSHIVCHIWLCAGTDLQCMFG
jgi:hypothetical protein